MSLGDQIRRRMMSDAEKGLALAAAQVLELAKGKIGVGDPALDPDPNVTLRDSGHIERQAGGRVYEVVFDTPYAAKQHEDQHLKHPRGGGPKYLERALLETLPRLEGIIAGEVRKNVSGGRR